MQLFDSVIGNPDRHAGNWVVTPQGHLASIDHNLAFATCDRHHFGADVPHALDDEEKGILDKFVKSRDRITKQLQRAGLPNPEIEWVWKRVDWMVEHGKTYAG